MTDEPLLFGFKSPARIRAGLAGSEELYHPCFECKAKQPELAGYLGYGREWKDILVVEEGSERYLALLCSECFRKYASSDRSK